MAGDWIKFRKLLLRDGRVRILSAKCPLDMLTAIGALVSLWCFADDYADENGMLVGYTKDDLDALIGVENFCESLPDDWIDLSGEWVKLPNYHDHNGSTAKRRASDQKRKQINRRCPQSVRKVSAKRPHATVTREEKRREENIKKIIPPKAPPKNLNSEAWSEYLDYRRTNNLRKLKPESVTKQQLWLVDQGDQNTQRRIVDETVRNGWTGLHELKGKSHAENQRTLSAVERVERANKLGAYADDETHGDDLGKDGEDLRPPLDGEFRREG